MSPILTITLNPTVDLATTAPEVVPELKLRCSSPHVDPGGGGINVARAIRLLGGQSTALISIGGQRGAQLLEMLALEGVPTVAFQGPGQTRLSFTVTEASSGLQYRFVTPGPTWGPADVDRALETIDRSAPDGALIVLSGSQPPGLAKEFPKILATHVTGRRARLIVDTSGPALRSVVEVPHAPLAVLRTDDIEAEELAGRKLSTVADTAAFARSLVDKGVAEAVIFARGAEGSVLVTSEGAWMAAPPPVKEVSKVGAGDSLIGALTLALSRDEPVQEAMRQGVAAAAAAVISPATQLCQRADFDRILPECILTSLT